MNELLEGFVAHVWYHRERQGREMVKKDAAAANNLTPVADFD